MTGSNRQPAGFNPDNSRFIGLSDGIFAFALTLLVINLKLPDADTVARRGLAQAVLGESRTFAIWVLSFYVISLYWQGHHRLVDILRGHDRRLLWLNLLFLLCISFIWYPTSVLGTYGQYQFAVLLYDGSLIVTSLVATALWQYAARNGRLLDQKTAEVAWHEEWFRTYGTVGVGLLSIAVSFVSVTAAELCWLLLVVHRAAGGRVLGPKRRPPLTGT